MHHTVAELERIRDEQLASLPKTGRTMHYWHFERRYKNGKGWKFQRDFFGSAQAAGKLFVRQFGPGYRMRRVLTYSTRTHDLEQHHVDALNSILAQNI